MISPESRRHFFPIAPNQSKMHFCLCLLQLFFLSSLETSGFDHSQGPINEQDGLFMSSGKAILMMLFQWRHLFASYFKGLFHHTWWNVWWPRDMVLEIFICHMGGKTKLYLVIYDYSACFGFAQCSQLVVARGVWQRLKMKGICTCRKPIKSWEWFI